LIFQFDRLVNAGILQGGEKLPFHKERGDTVLGHNVSSQGVLLQKLALNAALDIKRLFQRHQKSSRATR
jgi:hypothetical protein